jgi:hypothetical protein
MPLSEKMRRGLSQIYRSKGERRHIAGYYSADFVIDVEPIAHETRHSGSLVAEMAVR